MNLREYLAKHDGKPRPDGPECIRLAAAAGISTMSLYLAAIGHRIIGAPTAIALHRSSIGGLLEPEGVPVRDGIQFDRDANGKVVGFQPPAQVA